MIVLLSFEYNYSDILLSHNAHTQDVCARVLCSLCYINSTTFDLEAARWKGGDKSCKYRDESQETDRVKEEGEKEWNR